MSTNIAVNAITFDKPTGYGPKDVITMTVNYSDPNNTSSQISMLVLDSSGSYVAPTGANVFATLIVRDGQPLSVSDPLKRAWALVSDSGSVAVFRYTPPAS